MFENIGYAKEYYLKGKYIASKKISKKDRKETGYFGRKLETPKESFKIGKKQIKEGLQYTTILVPLSGKIIQAAEA
jgi:hypothetical protein